MVMAPLTAEELVEHQEFKNVVWDLKPTMQGTVEVAKGRGGPLGLAYEVHGNGPIRLVVKSSTSIRSYSSRCTVMLTVTF